MNPEKADDRAIRKVHTAVAMKDIRFHLGYILLTFDPCRLPHTDTDRRRPLGNIAVRMGDRRG